MKDSGDFLGQSSSQAKLSLKQRFLISASIEDFTNYVMAFPLLALGFAILYSVFFDFERSTGTSCQVPNYLPSISASIALTPQAYVWRISIAIQAFPRYVAAYSYWVWYSRQSFDEKKRLYRSRRMLMKVATGSNFLELSALLGLTLVSSREIKIFHETCFVLFVVGAMLHTFASCLLLSMVFPQQQHIKTSIKKKKFSLMLSAVSAAGATYTFIRHNVLCEPLTYTWFACCEYLIVASNGIFHHSITLDFKDYSFSIFSNK